MKTRTPKDQHDIPLGATVRDRITGINGVVIAKVEYLFGCTQYGIQGPAENGKRNDADYLDWQRLEVLNEGLHLRDINTSVATSRADGCGTAPGARRETPKL